MYLCYGLCKSFVDDYNQKNEKLSGGYGSRCPVAQDVIQSFITQDNKYIIVLNSVIGYNVYDMINDKLLFGDDLSYYISTAESCCRIKFDTFTDSVKSMFLNDEMIISSGGHGINFYYIPTKDFKSLTLIKQHRLQTIGIDGYFYHGMCCIGLKHTDKKIK